MVVYHKRFWVWWGLSLFLCKLYGSLKNMADRLLESPRYCVWPDEAFDQARAGGIRIRLDSS